MDITHLAIQLVVAIICAGISNLLVPREIPGKLFGLVVLGLTGVWLGEWGFRLLQRQYGINYAFLAWHVAGVPIIPSIVGSAIVLYLVTAFLKWGNYGR